MTTWETFAWGFAGSAAVEMVTLLSYYSARAGRLPARYRKAGFWVTRTILAVVAGLLAVAYEIDKRILAFNVGAATPLIVSFMARGVRRANSSLALDAPRDESPDDTASHPRSVHRPTGSSRGRR